MPVVATAGHVDHGKSTLVHALTGRDPDRWAEEKARGLTIDLGFAWRTFPTAGDVAFIDVPGHVRFISNMLAGVGAVDTCLFVVAATEGWKPQSEEHLRVLDVLGLHNGVVALTMCDLVDDERVEFVRLEVADQVAGTFLDGAPVLAVAAAAGRGVDELLAALDHAVATAPPAADRARPRLWIDRVFAARGAGTVVTGTLTGGTLTVGDELVVEPAGTPVRVRALQSHERSHDALGPGRRVAVNLTGVAHGDVARGDVLVRPHQWLQTAAADCTLSVGPNVGHEVSRRGAFHAHIGSGEYAVQVRVLAGEAIQPGATGRVRLHLPVALPLVAGDRYVLRESGRGETVGGGRVLDPAPVLAASKAAPDGSVERFVDERGWVDVDDLERAFAERRPPTVGRWAASDAAYIEATARLVAALPVDVATLDDRDAALLQHIDGVVVVHGRAMKEADAATDWAGHPYLAALRAAPFNPPDADGVDRAEVRELLRTGLAVECDGCYFAASAIQDASVCVADLLAASPDGVTVSAIREALGTSRKYALPLLSHLDATGVTRRRGDLRVAGPRLPAAGPGGPGGRAERRQ